MSYHSIEEHDSHFVLHHDKGHEVKIAKKGLSDGTIKRLKGFATGGEVSQEEAEKFNQGYNAQAIGGGNSNPKLQQSHVKNTQPKPKPEPQSYATGTPPEGVQPETNTPYAVEALPDESLGTYLGRTKVAPALNTLNEAKNAVGETLGNVATGVGRFVGDVSRGAGIAKAPTKGIKKASEESDTEELGNKNLLPPEQPEALPETAPAPTGADQMMGGLQKAGQEERSGIIQEQEALKKQAAMIEPQAKDEFEKQQNLADESHAFIQSNHELVNKTQQAVLNQELDYNRLWHNAGMGSKMMSAIGLALGGMGAGVTGGQNQAITMLNSMIDRDVNQQKDDLGRRETVLKSALDEYGNMTQAENSLKLQLEAATRAKIVQAQAANPTAEAMKLKLVGAFDQQMVGRIAQMDANRQLMNASSNGTKPGQIEHAIQQISMIDPKRGEELRDRYVPGMGLATTKEDASKVKEAYPKQQNFNYLMQQLIGLGKEAGVTGIWDPKKAVLAKSLASQAVNEYRAAQGMGVYKEAAANFEAALMGKDPSVMFSNIRYLPKVMSLYQSSQREANDFYKVRGLNPPAQPKVQQPSKNPKGWQEAGFKR